MYYFYFRLEGSYRNIIKNKRLKNQYVEKIKFDFKYKDMIDK